jgi:hypothetical protein
MIRKVFKRPSSAKYKTPSTITPEQKAQSDAEYREYISTLGPEQLRTERMKAESDLGEFFKPYGRPTKVLESKYTLERLPKVQSLDQLNQEYEDLGLGSMQPSDIIMKHNVDKPKIIWFLHGTEIKTEPTLFKGFPFEALNFYSPTQCVLYGPANYISPSSACDGTLGNVEQYVPNEAGEIEIVPMLFCVTSKDSIFHVGVYICLPENNPKLIRWHSYNWLSKLLALKKSYVEKINAEIELQNQDPNAVQKPLYSITYPTLNYIEIWYYSKQIIEEYNAENNTSYQPKDFQLCMVSCRNLVSSLTPTKVPVLSYEKPDPKNPSKMIRYTNMDFLNEPALFTGGKEKEKGKRHKKNNSRRKKKKSKSSSKTFKR